MVKFPKKSEESLSSLHPHRSPATSAQFNALFAVTDSLADVTGVGVLLSFDSHTGKTVRELFRSPTAILSFNTRALSGLWVSPAFLHFQIFCNGEVRLTLTFTVLFTPP